MKSIVVRNIMFGILASIVFLGCDNPTVFTPRSQEVITTGIEFTSVLFPFGWGETWGNPIAISKLDIGKDGASDGSNNRIPNYFELGLPYPNPADGAVSIQFAIPKTMKVQAWAETAYLPSDFNLPLGKNYQQKYQRIEIFDRNFEPGYFSERITMRSTCYYGEVEQGFYRIFLLADSEHLLFQDVYLGGDSRLAPIGLDKKNSGYHPCNAESIMSSNQPRNQKIIDTELNQRK